LAAKASRIYTAAVAGAGVLALLWMALTWPGGQAGLLLLFTLFAAVAELSPVSVAGGWVTLTFGVVFPAYLLLGPFGAALAVAVTQAGVGLGRRRPLFTTLFNIGQDVLAVAAGAAVASLVLHVPFPRAPGVFAPGSLVFIPVFMAVNHALVDVYTSLQLRLPVRTLWWEPLRIELLWSFLVVPLGVLMAVADRLYGMPAVVLLYLPVVAAAFLMRMWAGYRRRSEELGSLLTLSQRLASTLDWDTIVGVAEEVAGAFLDGVVEVHAGRRAGDAERAPLVRLSEEDLFRLLGIARSAIVREGEVELPPPFRGMLLAAIEGPGERFGYVLALVRLPEPVPADLQYLEAVAGQLALSLGNVLLHKETERLAISDAMLPQLFNYRHLIDTLRREVERAEASGTELSLIYFDLDSFKSINDRFGHLVGDEALRRLAERILTNIRGTDTAFRYAGDEFVVLLPGTSGDEAEEVARRIAQAVEEAPLIRELDAKTGVSYGVAAYRPGESWQEFLHRADARMYTHKEWRKSL
jgi:diguanylate cyclase (GGDEF)-like protein